MIKGEGGGGPYESVSLKLSLAPILNTVVVFRSWLRKGAELARVPEIELITWMSFWKACENEPRSETPVCQPFRTEIEGSIHWQPPDRLLARE